MNFEGSLSPGISGDGPRPRSSRRLAVLLFLNFAALITVFQGIQIVLLPTVVAKLAPAAKVGTTAFLLTLAAIASVVALFAGGAVSDRTRSRWGRRTPHLVVAGVASLALMSLVAGASSITQLSFLLPALWFTLNYYQAVLLAALPDRIPKRDLSFASAAIGMGAPVGIFGGITIASTAANPVLGYGLLAIPFIVTTLVLLVIEPEGSSVHLSVEKRQRLRMNSLLAQFSSFADRDFALAAISRAMLFLTYFSVTGYMFFLLQDYVGQANLPYGSLAAGLSILSGVITVAWLVVTPLTGWISERFQQTVAIVAGVSIAAGFVTLLPAFSNSWVVLLAFGLGTGITFGGYFVLDLKLATLVLPSEDTAGRDLGILLAAGTAPGVLAPAIAGAVIAASGYPALFVFGAVVAIAGGLCASLIRLRP